MSTFFLTLEFKKAICQTNSLLAQLMSLVLASL